MLTIHTESHGDLAVVECKGTIMKSDSVFKLRDFVQAQAPARVIALDLSEVRAIGGAGLGMLAFLERWARHHNSQLKLFSPSKAVLQGLVHNRTLLNFEIASFHEMMVMLANSDSEFAMAA
jgi:anti-anti-sigma regulatory factor